MAVQIEGLPRWPSGGNRRKLDEQWLSALEAGAGRGVLVEPSEGAPEALLAAIQEFNQGLYWECHETLEGVWRGTPYPLRFFYHAIIKVAVGLHHLSRHNRHGATVKLADGVRVLRLFQPRFLGVRTDLLLADASIWLERARKAGPTTWGELDRLPRPLIRLAQASHGR